MAGESTDLRREAADQPIAYCAVFPKIGIARVGDSKDYFVGPEAPGVPAAPEGGFKDGSGRVKRQAARFRVYGFDADGNVVAELTAQNAHRITWQVSVANKKAAWHEFAGAKAALALFEGAGDQAQLPPLRNDDWPTDRRALVMKATASVSGKNDASAPLQGTIYDVPDPVYLGELRTDNLGRLLVLGGHGHSAARSTDDKYLIDHYANNDGWYDDTADGSVSVEVEIAEGVVVPVRGNTWVIVGPPDYSPHTDSLVTLFDAMEDTALEKGLPWHLAATPPDRERTRVSFLNDVYPILFRAVDTQWVNERALRGHGPGKAANFLSDEILGALARNSEASEDLRKRFFSLVRNPNLTRDDAKKQASLKFMPQLSGNEGDSEGYIGDPDHWLKLTKRQYESLRLWSEGKFDGYDTLKELKLAMVRPAPIDQIALRDQPFALTKGALSACVGGPFYPGIELTAICTSEHFYERAFEVSARLEPGDLTKWMALPWQADFYECNTYWWPAQRPDAIVSEFDFEEVRKDFPIEREAANLASLLYPRKQWDRGVGSERTFQPLFEWPSTDGKDIATFAVDAKQAFVTFVRAQWTFRGRNWRLPEPKDGEALNRYQFRLREFFDHYGSTKHWPFVLPQAAPQVDPKAYRAQLIAAFDGYIQNVVPPPDSAEVLDVYAARLKTADSAWMNFLGASTQIGYEVRQDYQADNEMVRKWKHLGFVVPAPNLSERVLVETGRGKYDGLRDRDYFYIMLNYESYPDFGPKAKELAIHFLQAARDLQKTKQFRSDPTQNFWEFFEYTPSAFESRLSQIYEFLAAGERQPAESWTREALIKRQLQLAPFNQLDGSWLRYATNAGPIAEINSLLFEIWSDETGGGDPALNHANLYTALLQTLGIYLPNIRSRDYADNPAIFDSAYTNPLFELCISQHSDAFFPEILGMTLQLEWEVLGLWPGVKRLEANNISAQFYRMHIGIDNAVYGHGAKAKEAVKQYLDYVRAEAGPAEVARVWERIWTGYVAFATTGDISQDFAVWRDYPPTVEQQMIELIKQKKYFAQRNHFNVSEFGVVSNRMNDWFEDPQAFLDELANSRYVTPGNPSGSYFLNNRTTYEGPMYKIFSPSELALWADWVRWLGNVYGPAGAAPATPGEAMKKLVQSLSSSAANVHAHETRELAGTVNGARVKQSVADWFRAGPEALMAAISDAENGWISPGNASGSRFITDLLPSEFGMLNAIKRTIVDGSDGFTILTQWIDAGCPIPGGRPAAPAAAALRAVAGMGAAPPGRVYPVRAKPGLHRRQIFGQDAVH